MPVKDQVKNYARKLVEDRPDRSELHKIRRDCRPLAMTFADDGIVPNNPKFPVIFYRRVIRLNHKYDAGTVLDTLFEANGWGRSWRDTVYDFVHYHSQVYEVIGVARGSAILEVGGVKGRRIALKAGDVAVLPAGGPPADQSKPEFPGRWCIPGRWDLRRMHR